MFDVCVIAQNLVALGVFILAWHWLAAISQYLSAN